MKAKSIVILIFCFVTTQVEAQQTDKKWARTLAASFTPNYSGGWIGSYQPDVAGGFTQDQLADSFRKSDKSLKSFNFNLVFGKKINGYTQMLIGLSVVQNGFERVKTGKMYKYVIHPDVGIYPNNVSAGIMEVHYQYRSQYLSALIGIEKRLDGVRFQMEGASMWYSLGVMPAVQIKNELRIHTVGFTMPQGDYFVVKDYVATTVDTGVYRTLAKAVNLNAFLTAALRLEYDLSPEVHIFAAPRLLIPLLASAKGVQTFWSPQVGCDFGVRLPLD